MRVEGPLPREGRRDMRFCKWNPPNAGVANGRHTSRLVGAGAPGPATGPRFHRSLALSPRRLTHATEGRAGRAVHNDLQQQHSAQQREVDALGGKKLSSSAGSSKKRGEHGRQGSRHQTEQRPPQMIRAPTDEEELGVPARGRAHEGPVSQEIARIGPSRTWLPGSVTASRCTENSQQSPKSYGEFTKLKCDEERNRIGCFRKRLRSPWKESRRTQGNGQQICGAGVQRRATHSPLKMSSFAETVRK